MLKLSTGVILAMGTPLWGVASRCLRTAITIIAAVVRVVIAVIVTVVTAIAAAIWWALRWLGRHATGIAATCAVAACVLTAALAINGLIGNWMTAHDAEMEATKEERAFSEALSAATEEAERLQIRLRVASLAGAGVGAMTVGDHSVRFFISDGGSAVVLNGEEVYRHADSREEPDIYRGMGEWEHLIDAVEAWVETERKDKFGDIEED